MVDVGYHIRIGVKWIDWHLDTPFLDGRTVVCSRDDGSPAPFRFPLRVTGISYLMVVVHVYLELDDASTIVVTPFVRRIMIPFNVLLGLLICHDTFKYLTVSKGERYVVTNLAEG